MRTAISTIVVLAAWSLLGIADRSDSKAAELTSVRQYLKSHCIDCHGDSEPAGKVSLVRLGPITKTNAKTWRRVLEQIATGEMPPKDQPRPKLADRERTIAAIAADLKRAGVTVAPPGGPLPAEGNLVDHERLFSGFHKGPASSPPRFWRRSQSQYDALMEQLWVIPKLRYEKAGHRQDPMWAGFSYSRPFPQMDPGQFSNYAGGVHADEAVLRALMNAGAQIAERLTVEKPAYAKELQPPVAVGIPSGRRGSAWTKFLRTPPKRPPEFEPFLKKKLKPTLSQQRAAISRIFRLFLNREPRPAEFTRYGDLLKRSVEKRGSLSALRGVIIAVIVSPEFVLRMEIGRGPVDKHGRRMLSSNELAYAISHALTDDGPDSAIWKAARDGRLKTRSDVEREVRRILADGAIEKHRILRFFQEFFGYHRAGEVFKDKGGWQHEVKYLVRDADMLIEHILKKDKQVFAELLTTDRYFVAYPNIKDPKLFAAIRQHTIDLTKQQIEKTRKRKKNRKIGPPRNGQYSRAWSYLQGRALIPRTVHNDRGSAEMSYIRIYGFDGAAFEWTPNQPIKTPSRRAGILTHPAWLVAHSSNFDNSIVGRGHWIREKLLAGKIPDVPIDVEAQVPDEPEHSLRHRMRVTKAERCIRCHRRMDPLGFPFESYDHYGQYRTAERVGAGKRRNKTVPVDPRGAILESGESTLDGPVKDAVELVHKLAKSPRVRQSFIRHAFRYWMGRNETLADSPTLIAADQAYVKSGGSFQAVVVSLLTSDSFLYRK